MTPYVQSFKTRQQAIPEPRDDLRQALMAKPYEIDLAGKDIAQAVQCSMELGGFIASLTCDRVHNGQYVARFAWGSSLIAAQKPSSSDLLNRGTVALVRNQLAAISELQPMPLPLKPDTANGGMDTLRVGIAEEAAQRPRGVIDPASSATITHCATVGSTPTPAPTINPAKIDSKLIVKPLCHDCGQPYEGNECWICAPLARAMLAVRRKRRDRQLQKRFGRKQNYATTIR